MGERWLGILPNCYMYGNTDHFEAILYNKDFSLVFLFIDDFLDLLGLCFCFTITK